MYIIKIKEIYLLILNKIKNYIHHFKSVYIIYKKKFSKEVEDTSLMIDLILKKVILGTATIEEINFVKRRGVNIAKLISTGAVVALPGGILILITIQKIMQKFFKKNFIPDNFIKITDAEKINLKYKEYSNFISNIEIIEEENKGKISPLFDIEMIYIKKFRYNKRIIKMDTEYDVLKNNLFYYKDKDISDYLLVIKKYIYINKIK